jgi:AraC-like DNA-binding protein
MKWVYFVMTHQFNIFLLLFGAMQGWLLSIWFLRNQKKKIANLYFALFLIVVGLQLTFKVISKGWLWENAHFAYLISYDFPYLIGPLLYLYVRGRKENVFNWEDLLHFIPFATSLTVTFIALGSPVALRLHPYSDAVLQFISLSAYCILSLRLGNSLLSNFIKIVWVCETIIIITLAVMVMYYGRFPDVRVMFLLLSVLLYWISYQAISRPDLFLESASLPMMSLLRKSPKYAHSSLKPEEATRIEEGIRQIMVKEKLFLDSELTIETLSAKLKTSRHHLSQVLNERLNKTYADFVADLRLEEAKSRLSNPANNRFTIAAIALDSGFNSVSSFNELFKKRYQTTPSKFRDQQLNKMTA